MELFHRQFGRSVTLMQQAMDAMQAGFASGDQTTFDLAHDKLDEARVRQVQACQGRLFWSCPKDPSEMFLFPNMRPEGWVEEVLGSRARVRILRLLAADPRRVRTEREIASAVGMSPSSVHVALQDLRDAGLLDSQRVGRGHAIRLRTGLGVVATLERLFREERETLGRMEAAVRRSLPRGVACYLFGSTARGTAGRESDLDLLVVARTASKAEDAAALAARAIGRVAPARLNVLALDRAALRRRRSSPLLRKVLEEGRPWTSTRLEAFL